MFMYEIIGVLHDEIFSFVSQEWKVIREYPKFYDISSHDRKVKRIYKDRIGIPRVLESNYESGFLTYHAFCLLTDIDDTQDCIVSAIEERLNKIEVIVQNNQKALKEPIHEIKKIPYAIG